MLRFKPEKSFKNYLLINWQKLLLRHLLQLKIFSPSMINYLRYRSSHRRCSVKKLFLEISQSSQENTCTSLFFNKVACLGPETLLKKRLWHRLSCEFCEISKNTFLQNTSGGCFCRWYPNLGTILKSASHQCFSWIFFQQQQDHQRRLRFLLCYRFV